MRQLHHLVLTEQLAQARILSVERSKQRVQPLRLLPLVFLVVHIMESAGLRSVLFRSSSRIESSRMMFDIQIDRRMFEC